jgi:hypothetical protein
MAGVFSQQQRARLQNGLGRDVCGGELYAAHFLGTDSACKLIQLASTNPQASAAKAFPAAASANRSVFYHPDGSARTVSEVYNWALSKHGDAPLKNIAAPVIEAPKNDAPTAPSILTYSNSNSDARLADAEFALLAPDWLSSSMNQTGGLPRSPFLMTPGVFDILSNMSPANNDRTAVAQNRATS